MTYFYEVITFYVFYQVFYLPLALMVPPSVFAVHVQFNLLYQFWIHTEVLWDLSFTKGLAHLKSFSGTL